MNAASRMSFHALVCICVVTSTVSGQPAAKQEHELPDGAIKRFGSIRLQHLRSVRQLAFTADGKRLISLGDDFACSVWDVATGKELRRESWGDPKVPLDTVLANERLAMLLLGRVEPNMSRYGLATLSADGKHLLICRDEKLRILDAETGQLVAETSFKLGKTNALELSPDGKSVARFAVLQDYDPELTIVEIATGKQLHKSRNPNRYYTGMRYSPDGKFLAVRDNGNNIGLLELSSGKRVRLYEGHMGQLMGAVFTPGEGKLASVATDGVWLWDRASDEAVTKFTLDDLSVCAAAFSPNAKLLATTGKQNAIYVWSVAAVDQLRSLTGHTSMVTALAFSADGKTLASGAIDGTIRIWDATDGRDLTPCKHLPRLQPISLLKRGLLLVQAESGTTLHHMSEATGEILATYPGPTLQNTGLAIAPNGKFLALGHIELPVIKLWNVSANQEAFRLEGHNARANRMIFSNDAEYLATLSTQDRSLRIWSTRDGKALHKMELPQVIQEEAQLMFRGRVNIPELQNVQQVQDIAFSPDRRCVACAAVDGLVYQWEMATGKLRSRIPIGARNASQLLYSPSGKLLAAITSEDTLRICDVLEGKLVHGFVGREGEIRCIAFSPDSRLVAAGCVNGKVVLYDLMTGKEKRTFAGHQNVVQKLWFLDEGKILMSASPDGSILHWDVNASVNPASRVVNPDAARLDALWNRLAHTDAGEAYEAVGELARHPELAVKFLQSRLQPTPTLPVDRVQQLLASLDSSNFVVREKATEELLRCVEQARPMLKKALAESSSSEKTRRLQEIFEKSNQQRSNSDNMRVTRAVEALERMGNAEATAFLQHLSSGAPDALLTTSAKEAVQRLQAAH